MYFTCFYAPNLRRKSLPKESHVRNDASPDSSLRSCTVSFEKAEADQGIGVPSLLVAGR